MALGQSYVIGKAWGWTVKNAALLAGVDKAEAEHMGKCCGIGASAAVAIVTLDPLGAGATAAEQTANSLSNRL